MADTQVLGTCVFGREGSSPFSRTRVMSPDIIDTLHFFVKSLFIEVGN